MAAFGPLSPGTVPTGSIARFCQEAYLEKREGWRSARREAGRLDMKGPEPNRNREPESTPEEPVEQPVSRTANTRTANLPNRTAKCVHAPVQRAPGGGVQLLLFLPSQTCQKLRSREFLRGGLFQAPRAKSCTPARSSPCMHEKEVNRDSPIKLTATGPRAHEPEKGRRKAPRTSQGVLNSSMHVQYPAQVT